MRKLLYVPIIHTRSDLGSLGPALERVSVAQVGERHWAKHQETVEAFWKVIEAYLVSLDACDLKVYQDGLAAEGELGHKVVEEAARRGSVNHRLLLDLVRRGAELRVTEDLSLLLEEGWQLLQAAGLGPAAAGESGQGVRGRRKGRLTERRDRFVAVRINETLAEGETGILFMGAYHDVLSHLAKDILVTSVKDKEPLRAYFRELLAGKDQARIEELGSYLASPI